jgi:type III restriction enzyme
MSILTGDDRREAEKREEEARVWISGLEAVKNKVGVKVTYDLSATPFFPAWFWLSRRGTLFPWVVSDFSLIDAIESGIVKIPRVPVSDDSMRGDQPTYRELWLNVQGPSPKKGRGTESLGEEPVLPDALEGALADPLRALREVLPTMGNLRGTGKGPDAAGFHRRVQ